MRRLLVIFVLVAFAAGLYYSGYFEPGIEKMIIGQWKTAENEEILEFCSNGKLLLHFKDKKASAGYHFLPEEKMVVYFDKWKNPGGNPIRIKAKINEEGDLELYAKQSVLVYQRHIPNQEKEQIDGNNSTENDKRRSLK